MLLGDLEIELCLDRFSVPRRLSGRMLLRWRGRDRRARVCSGLAGLPTPFLRGPLLVMAFQLLSIAVIDVAVYLGWRAARYYSPGLLLTGLAVAGTRSAA
jgi:hypothetical protein